MSRGRHITGAVELGTHSQMNVGELELQMFFSQVEEIEKLNEKLDKHLRRIKDAHEKSKAATKPAILKELKNSMDKDVEEVGKIGRSMKSKIEELDRENLKNRLKPGCGQGTVSDRSRTATTANLKKTLKEKISEFQVLRTTIHQDNREVVERRIYTVTGQRVDESTVDRLIETGDSEQIFEKAIQEQGRGQVIDALAEIHERHLAVRSLEKHLLDLNQVFLDMGVVVDGQGEILENIETHVSSAVENVQSGNVALQSSKKLQRSSRKWTCLAILILLIILVIIIVAVIRPWNKNAA